MGVLIMYEIGVVPGKFFPPHRGHLNQIIRAATQCKKVYVVVSDDENIALDKCRKDNLPYIPLKTRALWLSIELQNIDNIKIVMLDETGIPPYPDGSVQWCKMLSALISEKMDVIFGGELEYQDTYMKFLPGVKYDVYDYKRSRYPVSGTEVRNDYLKHWDYILGSARSFFARRVLVTGTESCAKTTIVKYLGKIFHTSWSEEYGRYYSTDSLGGNEDLFSMGDFETIAQRQLNQDQDALKTANKIVFFDSDAVVTQYYCEMYMGQPNPLIEHFVDPQKYDVVLLMGPTVEWMPDGFRFKNKQEERELLHKKLLYMYLDRGFKDKIIEINDLEYSVRLDKAIEIADKLVADRTFMSRY
jgi:HTH-type transcriptional repressor of NAD biosynthesis genes